MTSVSQEGGHLQDVDLVDDGEGLEMLDFVGMPRQRGG